MKLTEEQIAAATQARVTMALAAIQRAQDELGRACEALSPLCAASSDYAACRALYDKVHKFWYRIDGIRNRNGLRLDRTNIEAIETRSEPNYRR